MSESLSDLERDVELARARLKGNLATLRAPETYSDFAHTVKQTAVDARDSIVEDVRGRTVSAFEEATEAVKAKAAANPAAALVIGAGLAWHFLRRPPIAAALIGGGLISLMRTKANGSANGADHLTVAKANLRRQAGELAGTAGEAGQQAAAYARAKASELSGQAREAASHAREQALGYARSAAADVSERVADAAGTAAETARSAVSSVRERAEAVTDQVRETAGALAERVRGEADGIREAIDERFDDDVLGAGDFYERPAAPTGARSLSAGNSGLSTDRLLLGAAGLAVAAAVGLALQSRPLAGTREALAAGARRVTGQEPETARTAKPASTTAKRKASPRSRSTKTPSSRPARGRRQASN